MEGEEKYEQFFLQEMKLTTNFLHFQEALRRQTMAFEPAKPKKKSRNLEMSFKPE